MSRVEHAKKYINILGIGKHGKHASKHIKLFGTNKRGKHAKDELVVYNPMYAKLSTCLGSFALATSLFTCATLGKYKGTLSSADTARVARYVVELTKEEEIVTEILPRTIKNIEFEVRNYEGNIENPDKKNEVEYKYKIKLETIDNIDLPIEYHLYRVYNQNEQSEISLTNGESGYIDVTQDSISHKYKLQLIWPNGYDEIIYQNLSDQIKISIESEQKD